MKAFVIATALAWSGMAFAQVSPPTDSPEATSDQAPPDATMPATPAVPDTTAPAPDATMPAPDATMPAPDAAPPPVNTMPPPANPNAAPMGTTGESVSTPAPATKNYPKCTRKLRDNCINPGGR